LSLRRRGAAVLLAANSTNARDLTRLLHRTPALQLETGLPAVLAHGRWTAIHDPLRILWCGELRANKALPLLLRALDRLPVSCRYELRVVGAGPMKRRWQRLARRHGIERHTTWFGWLPHRDVLQHYQWADVLAFTSLRDTSGNVVLEALGDGVPVVCLDHQGVHDIVTDRCGVRIPVTTPREVVDGIRDALVQLVQDPERWRGLSAGAVERAREYLWESQGEKMRAEYGRLLKDRKQPARGVVRRPDLTPLGDLIKWTGGHAAASLHRMLDDREADACGILAFHRVAPRRARLPKPSHNVTPERLREQIEGLLARGFVVASLDEVLSAHRRGVRPASKTVVLTFDDAYESVFEGAWPVLRELRLPATVFISTAFLDSLSPFPFDRWGLTHRAVTPPTHYRPLTTAQCREMQSSQLVSLGAHTHTHQDFRGRPEAFHADLAESISRLQSAFACRTVPFAFPFGRVDDEMVEVARATGVTCALTTRALPVQSGADPFGWGRFNVYQSDTAETLEAKFHGWYGWIPALGDRIGALRSLGSPEGRRGQAAERAGL